MSEIITITKNPFTYAYNTRLHKKSARASSTPSRTGETLTEHMDVSLRDGVETSTWQQNDMRFSGLRHSGCGDLSFFNICRGY